MTIVELMIVMVISAIVLFVAMQGVEIVQRLSIRQTREIVASNALFNDYLRLESALTSADSADYSQTVATIYCHQNRLLISNQDSTAVLGSDTLFASTYRITFSPRSGTDTLRVTITGRGTYVELALRVSQQALVTRREAIKNAEQNIIQAEQ